MLIDTHCHLDDERLHPLAENIISDMAKDGLYCVVTSSSDYESSVCNFALATNNRDVYATVGIHPQEASGRTTAQYDEFCKMAENEKVVAIGEVGLDYYYENSPREIQKTVLVEQMELAHFLRLPLVFHVRDAYGDFFDNLKDNKKLLEYGGTDSTGRLPIKTQGTRWRLRRKSPLTDCLSRRIVRTLRRRPFAAR